MGGLLRRGVAPGEVAAHRQHVEVQALDPIRVAPGEPRRDEGAPVAALRHEALVAEARHQRGKVVGDLLDAEARLAGAEGQPVSGKRGRHHREGILRPAAEAGRIGQARDQVEELEHRAGPAVTEEKRTGIRPATRHVQAVDVDLADALDGLRKGVERSFLGAPVEPVAPVGDEVGEVGDVGAVGPGRLGGLVGQAGAGEALAQVGKRRIRNVVGERLSRHRRLLPCRIPCMHRTGCRGRRRHARRPR